MLNRSSLCLLAAVGLLSTAGAQQPADSQKWYRCNTHTHTSAFPKSDANGSPEFVAEWYRSHGYQCLFITDHEHLTSVAALNEKYRGDFLVLPGQEVTQFVEGPISLGGITHTHINGLNLTRIDQPIRPVPLSAGMSTSQSYERNLKAIRAAGGIPQVNHPSIQWQITAKDLAALESPFLLEVWNAFPTVNNLAGTDESGQRGVTPEETWDALLTMGKTVWGVASDDAHEYRAFDDRETPTPGKGWIVVQARSLTAEAITEALEAGRFYASTGVLLEMYAADDKEIRFQIVRQRSWSPAGKSTTRYTTRFIGKGGKLLAEVHGLSPTYRIVGNEGYVRASVIDSDGRRAWTQPVWVRDTGASKN